MRFLKNVALAASTAVRHVNEDSVVLLLQLSRRMPAKVVQPVAKVACKALSTSVSPTAMIATIVAGEFAELENRFAKALTRGISGNHARLVADVALAAGRPEWADAFLPYAEGSHRFPSTLARRKWYGGDMSGAVAALASQRGSMGRQHDRLIGELKTFTGWSPNLPAKTMTPVSGRVLHFLTNSLPHTASGYAQRSHSIMTAQSDAGWNVLAVTRLGYPVQVGKIFAAEQDVVDGITYRRLLRARMAATAEERVQQEAQELLRVALEFRPEVLHTTTHFINGLVVSAVAKALGIPWVYEVRGQLADTWASTRSEEARKSQRYLEFCAREKTVMEAADSIFTLGETMKDNIVASGVPAAKVLLVPNAVGGDFLGPAKELRVARLALGLDPKLNYIGTVSSLVDYEGVDYLLDAFAILVPDFPSLRLLIVGNGTSAPALQDQAERLGLAERVIFTGRVPRDVTPLYHAALDIFVVPRKDLAVTRAVTPMKPVEALASSRPVVASNLPALREIIEENTNGRLSVAGNPVDLARVLAGLLADQDLREQLGAAGRTRVLATRTWAANAATYGAEYKKVIELSLHRTGGIRG